MKKYIFFSIAVLLITAHLYGAVESVVIDNQSGIDITVLIEYEDGTTETHSLSPAQKTPFYVETTCILSVSIYSERWRNVADIEADDKLVIPEGWNRCQSWIFTIKKRIDDTVHVATKKSIPSKAS